MIMEKINGTLRGRPDQFVTGLLFLVSAIALLIALYATPAIKTAAAAWFVAP